MSLGVSWALAQVGSFPRVSGDEPVFGSLP